MLMSSIASQVTTMQSSFSSQLGTLQSNFSRQLSAMSQQQSAMSHQQGSLTAEISGVLERLDRVEESLQGSGKGSPCPDYWTMRPAVTVCQIVAPGPSGQPQSSMVNLRESDYTERLCPETEPLRNRNLKISKALLKS